MLKDFVQKMHNGKCDAHEVTQQQFIIDPKTKKIRNKKSKKVLRNSEPQKRFINSKVSKCLTFGYGIRRWSDCQNGISNMIYDLFME